MAQLINSSPEADYDNISSVLFPGGVDEPGRLDGEKLMKSRFGNVVAWFTIDSLPDGNHPAEVKEAWCGVPLPVRGFSVHDAVNEVVPVLAVDAFNALADVRAPEVVLEYWAEAFQGQNPTLWFNANEGVIEANSLLKR